MQIQILIILGLLCISGVALHLKEEEIKLVPGWINSDATRWTGYSPDCELACT